MEAVFHHRELDFSGKKLLPVIFITFLLISLKTFSQSDVNTPAGSVPTLTIGANPGATSNTFLNTTGDPATPSCSSDIKCSFTGWYKYTTGALGGDLTLSMTVGTLKYGSMSIYSGTSGSFTQIACGDANSVTSTTPPPSITATCLLPNTTYYIMVWDDGSITSTGYPGTFTLNLTYTSNLSADICSSAITLSTGTVTGNNTCATYSATTDHTVSCQSNSAQYGYTVWYKYTTGASAGDLSVSLASGTINNAALA